MLRKRKTVGIPILKLSANRLSAVVQALSQHEYDRDGFREEVLSLFAGKIEKSVFRGMAIPTLRALGILVGFEAEMHLSGNGALVAEANEPGSPGTNAAMQAILLEIESEKGLGTGWHKKHVSVSAVRASLNEVDTTGGDSSGRLNRWLSYLEFFNIITKTQENYIRKIPPCSIKNHPPKLRLSEMKADFLTSYKSLAPRGIGEPVVSIDLLHRELALLRFKKNKDIITKRVFDEILSQCLQKDVLGIHLHRSMGADQGLFIYKDIAYQSISIRGTRNANAK